MCVCVCVCFFFVVVCLFVVVVVFFFCFFFLLFLCVCFLFCFVLKKTKCLKVFFSKPVTLCFSDLFKETDTYDQSNDVVALKSL